jgi:ribose transport system permease protein
VNTIISRESAPTGAPAPSRRLSASALRHTASRLAGRYSLVLVFAAIVVAFSIAKPDVFPTTQNAQTIASTNAVIALLALAAMLPLVVGKFDISVGYQLGLAQGLCAGLIIKHGMPAGLATVVVLAAGALVGAINGFLVAFLRLDSFISTLGVGILVLGVNEAYTKDLQITGAIPHTFAQLGRSSVAGVPLAIIYVLAVCALLWTLLEYTAWGRQAFATGGSERAALLAGVNTRRVTMGTFVLTGLLSAFAGVLSVMMLGGSSPVVGLSSLLPAFAGAFLGATSIRPGRFNAIGTVLAVYLLASGITGLQQLGVAFYVQEFFNGGALLVAVATSVFIARRRRGQAAPAS